MQKKNNQKKIVTWGSLGVGEIAVHRKTGIWSKDIRASLERRLNLVCCEGPTVESSITEGGRIVEQKFSMVLGKRLRKGGYEPQGDIWFSVSYV